MKHNNICGRSLHKLGVLEGGGDVHTGSSSATLFWEINSTQSELYILCTPFNSLGFRLVAVYFWWWLVGGGVNGGARVVAACEMLRPCVGDFKQA